MMDSFPCIIDLNVLPRRLSHQSSYSELLVLVLLAKSRQPLTGFFRVFSIPFTMQCHLASFCFGQCRVTSLGQNNKHFHISWCHPDSSFLTDHTQNTLQYFERFPVLHSLSIAGTIKQWFHFFIVYLDLLGLFCFCFSDC